MQGFLLKPKVPFFTLYPYALKLVLFNVCIRLTFDRFTILWDFCDQFFLFELSTEYDGAVATVFVGKSVFQSKSLTNWYTEIMLNLIYYMYIRLFLKVYLYRTY